MARIKYQLKPALSNRSHVESWRKQTPPQSAEACSPCDAYPDSSPTRAPEAAATSPPGRSRTTSTGRSSGHWPIAKLYTRYRRPSFFSLRSDAGGTDFSALSYTDYVPYQSPGNHEDIPPVPPLPPSTSHSHRTIVPFKTRSRPPTSASTTHPIPVNTPAPKVSPVTPPAIAGLDPFAERWLQENTYIGQPPSHSQARPPSTSGQSHRSQASRDHSDTSRVDDEPTSPHAEDYEIIGITNARRSIARLWPSRDAVPSLYRSNTLTHPRAGESSMEDVPLKRASTLGAYGQTAAQTVPVSASASATAGISTLDSSFVRPSPLTLLNSASTASPQPSGYTPSSRNRPQTPLRRGVSIKSAKTVRSFFSGWVKGTDANGMWTGRPDTPARPQTAARPDSGIFPLTLGLGTVDIPLPQVERSAHMFIELDPSSPLTASRPPSEWPDRRTRLGSGSQV